MSYIISSGITSDGIILENDSMTVLPGGIATKTKVNSGGSMYIAYSGGTANSATVNASGQMYVYNGGTANSATVNSGGRMYVYNGGTANCATVNASGHMVVSRGGTANSATVKSDGFFYVFSGGTANNIDLSEKPYYTFSVASDTYIQGTSNGIAFEIKDACVSDYVIDGGGNLTVYSGGMANNDTVNEYGILNISSGGTADGVKVQSEGVFNVSSGGTAVNLDLSENACYSFVVASDTYIQGTSNGIAFEIKDGLVSDFVINADFCSIHVFDGGTANGVTVQSSWSEFYVYSGGVANSAMVSSRGNIYIYSGGTANSPAVNYFGRLTIFSSGMANNASVSGGRLFVSSGGTATDATIDQYGQLYISSGGTADSPAVKSDGLIQVLSSGSITGRVSIECGAIAVFKDQAVLDFDLTRTSAGGAALVNGLSRIKGAPIYTLTVDAEQGTGDYLLARSVENFDQTISVSNTSGEELGALSVGQSVEIGDATYTLSLNNDRLVLSIREPDHGPDTVAPTVFNVAASSDQPTFRPVTVTADFADDVELKSALYRIGEDGAWTDYADGVTVYENTTVYFKGIDAAGNESEVVSRTVSNIEPDARGPVYVYLDFDGEQTAYDNRDLNLSFSVSVANPGYSDERKQTILTTLSEKYRSEGVVFTLTRPGDAGYSTVYFGKSDAFNAYGDFFGVAETIDTCNKTSSDDAFVLLDNAYSTDQIVSVAVNVLDRILGDHYCVKGEKTLRDYAAASVLLSTQWHQGDPFNKYCPVDPKTGYHIDDQYFVGCTNTAAAQVIYYWIENGLLDFSLALNDTDKAVTENDVVIDSNPVTASQNGYLPFDEVNRLLADFKVGDEDSIAALCFAAGVVQKSLYQSDGTQAGFDLDLLVRSGFQKESISYNFYGDYSKFMSDSGREILIRDLLSGRPVEAVIKYNQGYGKGSAHAIVVDGYNSATDEFHVNFGAGGGYDGWYSLNNLDERFGVDGFGIGIEPIVSSQLTVSAMSFEPDMVNGDEDVVLHFSIANTGKRRSKETTAYVYLGDKLLDSFFFDSLYIGETRDFSCTVANPELSLGANVITVQVGSRKDEGDISSLSGTVRVYDGAITDADDTWVLAAAGGDRTRIAAEYDAEGNVAETALAEGEYVGVRDLVDFREATLGHAGKYTFTLSGFASDVELALYSLTAKGNLKLVKSIFVFAPDDTAALSEVPLEKGTYYISVRAVNEETPGDSDYRLVFSGKGYVKADASDDWKDLEQAGVDGSVGSVGVIDGETEEIITDGWVGLGDEFDYRLFELPCPAETSFTIAASDAVKFTVYEIREKTNKKGVTTYSLKSLQSAKVKAGASATTKGLLLPAGNTPGKYCFSVQSTNASKGGSADYALTFNQAGSEFFAKGDSSDDWGDVKSAGADGAVGDAGEIDGESSLLLENWVGFGDAADYKAFRVASGAKLSFALEASDKAKFTVWKLNSKTDRKGVATYSLKSLQSTSLAKDRKSGTYAATTKGLLLESGEYYFAMESTNAKKGGSADYSVSLNDGASVFYVDADDGANGWLYDKKSGPNKAVCEADAIVIHSASTDIRLDSEKPDAEGRDNFVGFGDEADYRKIKLETDAALSFAVTASDACKFMLLSLAEGVDKKGQPKYTVKTLQTTKLSKPKGGTEYAATTGTLELAAGEYYVAVQSTNAKKGGSAWYNVSLNLDGCAGLQEAKDLDALSAGATASPTSDVLALTDALNLGLSGADAVPADAIAAPFAAAPDDAIIWRNADMLA